LYSLLGKRRVEDERLYMIGKGLDYGRLLIRKKETRSSVSIPVPMSAAVSFIAECCLAYLLYSAECTRFVYALSVGANGNVLASVAADKNTFQILTPCVVPP
jgi:hypothetical protein